MTDAPEPKRPRRLRNEYSGYVLTRSNQNNIPVLDCSSDGSASLSAEDFFKTVVQKRCPMLLRHGLESGGRTKIMEDMDVIWKQWRSSEYLDEIAGRAQVHVERRTSKDDRYGKAREQGEEVMTFGEFLQILQDPQKRDLYYMTTQPLQVDEEGRPQLLSEPLTSLMKDFPLRPKLAGNLVPMNCNLWMGYSKEGSTSGLHHDYHDNFYMLLKGNKCFDLYSPDQVDQMKTRGTIDHVFPNGLIHYEGEPPVTATGVELASLKAWEAHQHQKKCEEAVSLAEAAVREGKPDGAAQLEEAEEALEDALEQVLGTEMGQDDDGDNSNEGQDFWTAMGKKTNNCDGSVEEETEFSEEEDSDDEEAPPEKLNNFSTIESGVAKDIPRAQVKVQAGDILFLPAGWFHSVTSYSAAVNGENTEEEAHCAFNYWLHPPDNNDFDQPYQSGFWPSDWSDRMESM
eukprot:scaffold138915_cov42-Attheya_sp.AAC.2